VPREGTAQDWLVVLRVEQRGGQGREHVIVPHHKERLSHVPSSHGTWCSRSPVPTAGLACLAAAAAAAAAPSAGAAVRPLPGDHAMTAATAPRRGMGTIVTGAAT
jgi:hypothetical protein